MEDKLLPSHHRLLIQLHHKGWRSVSGASSKYDDRYPIALLGLGTLNFNIRKLQMGSYSFIIVPQSEFKLCIDALNQTAIDFFPCPTSYLCSYLFCLCTLGVMLLCGDPGITEVPSSKNELINLK